jgi:predicted nucleic acid-binding protein
MKGVPIPTIFFDACSLGRPYDLSNTSKILLETDAILHIMKCVERELLRWVGSNILKAEIQASQFEERRDRILASYNAMCDSSDVIASDFENAAALVRGNIGPIDAIHLAFAERNGCNFLFTTDDKFIRRVKRWKGKLNVTVLNPLEWWRQNAPRL